MFPLLIIPAFCIWGIGFSKFGIWEFHFPTLFLWSAFTAMIPSVLLIKGWLAKIKMSRGVRFLFSGMIYFLCVPVCAGFLLMVNRGFSNGKLVARKVTVLEKKEYQAEHGYTMRVLFVSGWAESPEKVALVEHQHIRTSTYDRMTTNDTLVVTTGVGVFGWQHLESVTEE